MQPLISNVKVTTMNGKEYNVEAHDYGVVPWMYPNEENAKDAYLTCFTLGARRASSAVPVELANLSKEPEKFRLSEEVAFVEDLMYEIDKSGIENIDWPVK